MSRLTESERHLSSGSAYWKELYHIRTGSEMNPQRNWSWTRHQHFMDRSRLSSSVWAAGTELSRLTGPGPVHCPQNLLLRNHLLKWQSHKNNEGGDLLLQPQWTSQHQQNCVIRTTSDVETRQNSRLTSRQGSIRTLVACSSQGVSSFWKQYMKSGW